MNMLKQIYYWLFPDWEIVDVMVSRWEITQGSLYNDFTELVSYSFLYSKRLNKHKLKCSGHKAKFHPMYRKAVEHLNQLTNEKQISSTNIK